MMNRTLHPCVAVAVLAWTCVGASANLLVNGNAETANTTGWTSVGGATVHTTPALGTTGLPVGEDIGGYSFYGGTGSSSSSLSQTVSVAGSAAAIDAGLMQSAFRILIQSRTDGVTTDTVTGQLRFLSLGAVALDSFGFSDPHIVVNPYDWALVTDLRIVPLGTRSIELTLNFHRAGGASTDAFADNASLDLVPVPEPSSVALVLCGLCGMMRRKRA